MSIYDGKVIKEDGLVEEFLEVPGGDLVAKLLLQMSRVPQFVKLFGPYTKGKDQQRWADYQRQDWSIRQLPAISVFESQTETKESDNAWVRGAVTIHAYWAPNMRRSDLTRVPMTFRGILLNFFSSEYVTAMLDELYYIERDSKVAGLNELGKDLIWTPNVEGIVDSQMVPVTMVDVRYRIDLRAWYRTLEYTNRTKEEPFTKPLGDLDTIAGEYDGVYNEEGDPTEVAVEQNITVENP